MQIRANASNYLQIALDPDLIASVCVVFLGDKNQFNRTESERVRERRERFSIGGETGRRAAGCHHVVATGSKPTPNKAAWCLLIDKKTVSKGQKPLVTSHITEGHHKWSVMCTGREPAL